MIKNPVSNFLYTYFFRFHFLFSIVIYYYASSYIELFNAYVIYTLCTIIAPLMYDFATSTLLHVGLFITKFFKSPLQNEYITWATIVLWIFATICSITFFTVFYTSFNVPLTNWLSFPLPENTNLINIILLYTEILLIGAVVLIVILDTIATILLNFKAMPESHAFYAIQNDFILKTNDYWSYFRPNYTTDSYLDEQTEISNYESYEYSVQSEELFDSIFTFFSLVLVLVILVPALGYLYTEEFYFDFLLYDVSIEVTAAQWYWTYEIRVQYLFTLEVFTTRSFKMDLVEVHTFLVNEVDTTRLWETEFTLDLPSNINICVSITSADVVHSWALPGYGTKSDAVPGRISNIVIESQAVGYIWGQCSELCGIFHGFMPISLSWNDGRFFWNSHLYRGDLCHLYIMRGPFRFLQTMFGCEPRNYQREYEAKMRSLESAEALEFYNYMLEKNQARIDAQTAYRESFGIRAREAAELYKKEHPRYYDFDRIPDIRIRQFWDDEDIIKYFDRLFNDEIEFFVKHLNTPNTRFNWSEREKYHLLRRHADIVPVLKGYDLHMWTIGFVGYMSCMAIAFRIILEQMAEDDANK